LQEEERKGCTECLQSWNPPRKQDANAQPTDEVILEKKLYGVEKRAKVVQINEWDCRPLSKRIIDPNKTWKFTEHLQEQKLEATDTVSEVKRLFKLVYP